MELSIGLGPSNIYLVYALLILLVNIAADKNRYFSLSFSSNIFFHQNVLIIQLSLFFIDS